MRAIVQVSCVGPAMYQHSNYRYNRQSFGGYRRKNGNMIRRRPHLNFVVLRLERNTDTTSAVSAQWTPRWYGDEFETIFMMAYY